MQRFLVRVLGLIPSRLPVGMDEFERLVDSLINNYDLPTKDRTSIRYVVANLITSISSTTTHKSKHYFYSALTSAGARQIASAVFQNIRTEQALAAEAAKKAALDAQLKDETNGQPVVSV